MRENLQFFSPHSPIFPHFPISPYSLFANKTHERSDYRLWRSWGGDRLRT
ncbi:hypothetical protein [Nostoc sp. NIES-3756]|nr:hypothetical protein [Nostoc sp. NIES-3756]